jgi:carboxypeptidase Taq
MTAAAAYDDLIRRSKELGLLNSCAAVLAWDQQTYMPTNGGGLRGNQMALLATLAHQKATDPKIGELLATIEGSSLIADTDSPEAANVRELRRAYDRSTKLPPALVAELAQVTSEAQQVWTVAKPKSDFAAFRPWLEKVVALKRQEADAVGFREHPYDALIEEYEPGTTVAELKVLFAGLTRDLVPLIQKIADSPQKPDRSVLEREYPVDRQKIFAEAAASAFGFDFGAGRLDTTAHPFCSGIGPGDCRITTRYNPRFFSESFFGVLHETGHALYEQNLPPEHFGTPLGSACSFGIHESQSRLWENQVGRGRPFWEHFFPRLKQTFPAALRDVSLEKFYAAANDVRPSLIRVEADEATYNLHIALRFELELGLLTGDLPVADLPGAWNERIKSFLGLDVPDHARGCLQDIHWSFGGIGYFPTYTLGNLYAAQFMDAARRDLGHGLEVGFRAGDFSPLKSWLTKHIHQHGQRFRAGELCRRATGEPLSSVSLLAHLNEKYGMVYGVC